MAIVEMNRSQSPGPEGVCPTGFVADRGRPPDQAVRPPRGRQRTLLCRASRTSHRRSQANGIAAAWTLLAGGLLYVVRRQLLGASER